MKQRAGSLRQLIKREKNLYLNKGKGREKIQINKIRNKKEDLTRDTEEIQKIITSFYKNLYSTKLENIEAMDNFLDRYHISKLNQSQGTI